MGDEHRIAPRRRVLKAGSISFGGGAFDCTVRNISDTGAALEVVTPLFIPDKFTLIVPSDGLSRPCSVVWRRERRIGVTFDWQWKPAAMIGLNREQPATIDGRAHSPAGRARTDDMPVAITMPFAAPATDQGTHSVALRPSPVRNTRKHHNNRVIARSRSTLENNSESYPALPLGAKQNPQIAIDLLADLSGSHYPGRHHELAWFDQLADCVFPAPDSGFTLLNREFDVVVDHDLTSWSLRKNDSKGYDPGAVLVSTRPGVGSWDRA
jgi:hypothetical protein